MNRLKKRIELGLLILTTLVLIPGVARSTINSVQVEGFNLRNDAGFNGTFAAPNSYNNDTYTSVRHGRNQGVVVSANATAATTCQWYNGSTWTTLVSNTPYAVNGGTLTWSAAGNFGGSATWVPTALSGTAVYNSLKFTDSGSNRYVRIQGIKQHPIAIVGDVNGDGYFATSGSTALDATALRSYVAGTGYLPSPAAWLRMNVNRSQTASGALPSDVTGGASCTASTINDDACYMEQTLGLVAGYNPTGFAVTADTSGTTTNTGYTATVTNKGELSRLCGTGGFSCAAGVNAVVYEPGHEGTPKWAIGYNVTSYPRPVDLYDTNPSTGNPHLDSDLGYSGMHGLRDASGMAVSIKNSKGTPLLWIINDDYHRREFGRLLADYAAPYHLHDNRPEIFAFQPTAAGQKVTWKGRFMLDRRLGTDAKPFHSPGPVDPVTGHGVTTDGYSDDKYEALSLLPSGKTYGQSDLFLFDSTSWHMDNYNAPETAQWVKVHNIQHQQLFDNGSDGQCANFYDPLACEAVEGCWWGSNCRELKFRVAAGTSDTIWFDNIDPHTGIVNPSLNDYYTAITVYRFPEPTIQPSPGYREPSINYGANPPVYNTSNEVIQSVDRFILNIPNGGNNKPLGRSERHDIQSAAVDPITGKVVVITSFTRIGLDSGSDIGKIRDDDTAIGYTRTADVNESLDAGDDPKNVSDSPKIFGKSRVWTFDLLDSSGNWKSPNDSWDSASKAWTPINIPSTYTLLQLWTYDDPERPAGTDSNKPWLDFTRFPARAALQSTPDLGGYNHTEWASSRLTEAKDIVFDPMGTHMYLVNHNKSGAAADKGGSKKINGAGLFVFPRTMTTNPPKTISAALRYVGGEVNENTLIQPLHRGNEYNLQALALGPDGFYTASEIEPAIAESGHQEFVPVRFVARAPSSTATFYNNAAVPTAYPNSPVGCSGSDCMDYVVTVSNVTQTIAVINTTGASFSFHTRSVGILGNQSARPDWISFSGCTGTVDTTVRSNEWKWTLASGASCTLSVTVNPNLLKDAYGNVPGGTGLYRAELQIGSAYTDGSKPPALYRSIFITVRK